MSSIKTICIDNPKKAGYYGYKWKLFARYNFVPLGYYWNSEVQSCEAYEVRQKLSFRFIGIVDWIKIKRFFRIIKDVD